MLEGLSAVDWRNMFHAYGTAEDVPDQLRSLVSADAKQRDDALFQLFSNISHQGTVYAATAHAVPFLWEILSSNADCDRSGVASLIGAIANGKGYHASSPTTEEELWISECRTAVRKGLSIAASCLTSTDVPLRMLCAHILATFPEDAEQFRPALREALHREKQVERRVGLGVALVLLGDPAPEAFVSRQPTSLPLIRLREFAQRAADGLTKREYALDLVFECALDRVDVDTILEWLDDRERWGGEDDI